MQCIKRNVLSFFVESKEEAGKIVYNANECAVYGTHKRSGVHTMRIDELSSTTQERISDLLRPVAGEADDPKAAKMSQAELARQLGINAATFSRFMSGKTTTITNENLVKMAEIFNVSTDYLLGLTNIKEKMNHAASELGLSTEAAQNLYTHRANPTVVNLLLTNETFLKVLNRLVLYFDEVFAAAFATRNQQIASLRDLVMDIGTPAALQTAQTVDLMKEPIYQADETTLQSEFLAAIRQIKEKVGENRAEQTAAFTDEQMELYAKLLGKGQLAFLPQMDQHQVAEKLLSPLQTLDCIRSETRQDLIRAVGNVMDDLKAKHERVKQTAASGGMDETNVDCRCGG